jgi:hypothetical protein
MSADSNKRWLLIHLWWERKQGQCQLVLILAGALCHISFFVLVHSYAHVGLYLFSTVIHSRPARAKKKQKNRYTKATNKIAICPTLPKNSHTSPQKNLPHHPFFGKHHTMAASVTAAPFPKLQKAQRRRSPPPPHHHRRRRPRGCALPGAHSGPPGATIVAQKEAQVGGGAFFMALVHLGQIPKRHSSRG